MSNSNDHFTKRQRGHRRRFAHSELHIKPSSANDGIKLQGHNNGWCILEWSTNSNGRGTLILRDGVIIKVQLVGGHSDDNYIMGKVGIGYDSPTAKLHINDTAIITFYWIISYEQWYT